MAWLGRAATLMLLVAVLLASASSPTAAAAGQEETCEFDQLFPLVSTAARPLRPSVHVLEERGSGRSVAAQDGD